MKKNDTLHQLILALSSSEKRFFRIHASSSSNRANSIYIELFDILCSQKNYNEKELLSHFKNVNFKKNLSQYKSYLRNLILKSLRENYEKKPADEVYELLREYEILQNKLLFDEGIKKLLRAKEIATKYELFNLHIGILEIEIIHYIKRDFNKSEQFYDEYITQKKILNEKILLSSNLNSLRKEVYILMIKFNKKIDSNQLNTLTEKIAAYNFEKIISYNSFVIEKKYWEIKEDYFLLSNKLNEYLSSLENQLFLFTKKYLHFKDVEEKHYINAYINYISAVFKNGDFVLLNKLLEEASNLQTNSESLRLIMFQKITSNKLSLYLNTGRLDDAKTLEIEFNKIYKQKKDKIDLVDLLSIYYNFALIYFFNMQFEKCLSWLQKLEKIKQKFRKDIFSDAAIINILCHFELKNYIFLQSIVRAKSRQMDILEIEKILVKSILKLTNPNTDSKLTFMNLKVSLDGLTASHKNVDWTTFNIWLQSKLENKTITEIYLKEVNG